jgi:hypothetical protein
MSSDEQGVEFLAGGTYYVLLSDGEGRLVRETGSRGKARGPGSN